MCTNTTLAKILDSAMLTPSVTFTMCRSISRSSCSICSVMFDSTALMWLICSRYINQYDMPLYRLRCLWCYGTTCLCCSFDNVHNSNNFYAPLCTMWSHLCYITLMVYYRSVYFFKILAVFCSWLPKSLTLTMVHSVTYDSDLSHCILLRLF